MPKARLVVQRLQSEALVRALNHQEGVEISLSARLIGRPVVSVAAGSVLQIGAASRVVSDSHRTALGVNHPVVLRTMRPGAEIVMGRNVGISGGSICAARSITIGDGTMLGANVTVCDTDFHPLDHPQRWNQPLPEPRDRDAVVIGPNCFLGTGAIILKGTHFGAGCVVGAGSVVTGDFPPGSIIAGSPARVLRTLSNSIPTSMAQAPAS